MVAASDSRGSRAVELAMVASIFGLAGIACGLFMFWTAPFSQKFMWWASRMLSAAAAAAIAGSGAWWALCGRRLGYSVWRWLLAGFLAGSLCYPLYYLLSPRFDGSWVRADELPLEWLFSFLVSGGFVITIPAGLIAAGLCRVLVEFRLRRAGGL